MGILIGVIVGYELSLMVFGKNNWKLYLIIALTFCGLLLILKHIPILAILVLLVISIFALRSNK